MSNVLSSVSIFYKLFSPSFFLLFLTSVNRWLAGGKGSSQSCLSSRLFSFYILSPSFFLRSLSVHGWLLLLLRPSNFVSLKIKQEKCWRREEVNDKQPRATELMKVRLIKSANNAFLNLTQSISLEGYLKIMTHTHTQKMSIV